MLFISIRIYCYHLDLIAKREMILPEIIGNH